MQMCNDSPPLFFLQGSAWISNSRKPGFSHGTQSLIFLCHSMVYNYIWYPSAFNPTLMIKLQPLEFLWDHSTTFTIFQFPVLPYNWQCLSILSLSHLSTEGNRFVHSNNILLLHLCWYTVLSAYLGFLLCLKYISLRWSVLYKKAADNGNHNLKWLCYLLFFGNLMFGGEGRVLCLTVKQRTEVFTGLFIHIISRIYCI